VSSSGSLKNLAQAPEPSNLSGWEDSGAGPSTLLQCPRCRSFDIRTHPRRGRGGETFAHLHCGHCQEAGFFQIAPSWSDAPEDWPAATFTALQAEWLEWYRLKQRYLDSGSARPTLPPAKVRLLLGIIVGLLLFLGLERLHWFGMLPESPDLRQHHIELYRSHLLQTGCLSANMQAKLRTVPIFFTAEQPVHGDWVKYGEAGVYWGEEAIKIYRPNFWSWGKPRHSVLVETLVHEVRHRVSPALRHNERFQKLVAQETACALRRW
jgi:hypothetical protein